MIFEANDAERIIRHISLMHSHVNEHHIETFRELVEKDPQKAIEEFSDSIKRLLSVGNGFFSGLQAGGPCELVTGPMLDSIGLVYPLLAWDLRKKALIKCMDFLDRQNYFLSQSNVELINEPWLVRDIIINSRWLYWCGFAEHAELIKPMTFWSEFEREFIVDGSFKCRSLFWLAYTVARQDFCHPTIRHCFTEEFPDFIDRTKDAIAAFSWFIGNERNKPPEEIIVKDFGPEWSEDLLSRISKQQWILLK